MRVEVPVTLEDFNGLFIEATAIVELTPGEPMVRYYPDGSGYPGSPPTAELISVYIDVVEDEHGFEARVSSEEVLDYLEQNPDLWEERAFEYGNES